MRKSSRTQLDLFVTPPRPTELAGAERQKAVALLQALLTEAVMTLACELPTSAKKEAGNE